MTDSVRQIGAAGEAAADEFLQKQGYQILERNFRIKMGEIDIIAVDNGVLVFVEVKNFKENSFLNPLEAVTPAKQQKILRTAQFYLSGHGYHKKNVRFDLVSVRHPVSGPAVACELFKNIF